MQIIRKTFKSPIILILTSLVFGILLVAGGYYLSKFISTKQPVSVLQVAPEQACNLTFTVEHDSSAPNIECQKLVDGKNANLSTNAVIIEKGQTFQYTLKLTNKSTTKDYNIQSFIDKFITDNSAYIQLKTITLKPDGVTCSFSKATGNIDQATCDFANYTLAKGSTLTVEIEALAKESTPQPIENQLVANVIDPSNNQVKNATCPAFVTIADKVYTALSCEKVLTPETAKVGDTVTGNIKVKTRSITSEADLLDGEIMIDKAPNSLTFTVKDPLYLITALANNNIDWLTGPAIDSSTYPNCSIVAETGGNSINCSYTNFDTTTNNGLVLPFTATIGAEAVVGQNITNKAQVTVGDKTAICSDTVAIAQTTTKSVSCTKTFLDANENIISNGTKIKQGSRVISRITITNTGNTTLDNLSLDDPLNNTYSDQGASNLNYLTYKEMRNGTPAQITNRCTFSDDMRRFTCNYLDSEAKDPIVVAPATPLNIDTVVEVNSDVKKDSKIVNVAKIFDASNGDLVAYCNDDILATVKDEPKPSTHGECQDKACVEVEGEGDSECTNDRQCSYGTCSNESCQIVACDTGNCKTSCVDDIDCRGNTETHLSCQNQACVVVSGSGSNQCATNTDCSVLSSTAPVSQVPDTGAFERTIAITVFATALIFLGVALSVL